MGKLQPGVNDLYTWCLNNGAYGQQLISEWTGECNDGKQYQMNDIGKSSGKDFLWKCSNGHTWYSDPGHRTYSKTKCKICSQKSFRLNVGVNDLYTWCQNNGSYGQQILSEWTGEIFNGLDTYKISEISYGSGKEFIWKCSKGHTWHARVTTRTTKKEGCPLCCSIGTSYPEQFIYWALKQIYPQAISRGKYQGIEFDITIPEERTCIEYSPTRWHEGKEDKDKAKADLCKQHNVRFIYIMEDSDNKYNERWEENFICLHMTEQHKEQYCIKIVEHILKSLNRSISEINISNVKKLAIEYSKGKIPKDQTLQYKYPGLAKEWHPTKNMYTTKGVSSRSHIKAYWQCTKCGYGSNGEWCISINRRTAKGYETGCPKCGYNWSMHGYKQTASGMTTADNSLESLYPELAKEWNEAFNSCKPSEIKSGTRKEVFWKCNHCGYGENGEWYRVPLQRIKRKSGCPKCSYNWYSGDYKTSSNRCIKGHNDLQSQLPALVTEWHPTLNNITPDSISKRGSTKVYWQCNHCGYGSDGEWFVAPNRRTAINHESGCPQCGYNWHRAMTGQPQKLKFPYD